jgi:hypothetical protein
MIKTVIGCLSGVLVVCALAVFPGLAAEKAQQYANQSYGFSFPLSEDVRLYTPDNPGPFAFGEHTIFILVNKWKPSDLIMGNLSEVADEKGLSDLRSSLESRGLPQPGYRKIAIQNATIGKNQEKRALEHIFELQGQAPRIMRQVCVVHRGKGLTFVCTANADRFQETDKTFFEPVLRSITFE